MSAQEDAAGMVRAVGDAEEEDAALVRTELARLPSPILAALRRAGVGVRVCRGTVTAYRRDLAGVVPRGWPAGTTWDVVPGCYLPDEHNVCIGMVRTGADWLIPPKGHGHNAWSLVLHETMHADDYVATSRRSQNPAFLQARTADIAALDTYQGQAGAAGCEETFAESAARAFGGDGTLMQACAHLADFWQRTPQPVPPGPSGHRASGGHGNNSIGTARLLPDGAIELDLRADDPSAIGGHALFAIGADDPRHALLLDRLRAERRTIRTGERVLLMAF